MGCFGQFTPHNDGFEKFRAALRTEPKTIRCLIECSDRLLFRMTPQQMIYCASDCFNETDECMFNYFKAYELTKNPLVQEYCLLKYKETLDTRTVVSRYLPQTKAKNIIELIDKLFEESRSEKYHPEDFSDIDSAYDSIY